MSRTNTSRKPLTPEPAVLFVQANRLGTHFRNRVTESFAFRVQLRIKRICDIVGSGILIVVCSPILLAALLAVRFSSSGPTFFSQLRWGLNQEQFRCFKVRTMHVHQESQQSQEDRSRGILFKTRNDCRVTPLGALLRKTSIDELPQLFNVLLGHMSLVGPRPLMIHMLEPFPEIRDVRCVMRPGITGLWQIRNRANNTSVMDMIDDDADYIAHFSLWLDVKVLLITPWVVALGSGAD